MNRENLQRMADYIRTVQDSAFDMKNFRNANDMESNECKSVGCVIGHCTALDEPENLEKYSNGRINFGKWSIKFTGLPMDAQAWRWCFSGAWWDVDNTKEGAAARIEWLLNHGLPANWPEQMCGEHELCYK